MQINVLEYLENGALAKCRTKTAIVDGAHHFTFEEVEHYAKNLAALIIRRNVAWNQPVAVFLPKGAATIFADIGIIYSGNCYANLDIKSPTERLRAILGNLGPCLVITSGAHSTVICGQGVPEERTILIEEAMESGRLYDFESLASRREQIIDTDPLCIIHTSGSTGVPKGVALNHRSTIDFMDWVFERFSFDGTERIGSLSPFYFDIYTLELYLCLAKGATLIIIPEECAAFPVKLVGYLSAHSISFIFWVPTIMVNIANQDLMDGAKVDCLKRIFFAGEVFPTKHFNYWQKRLPEAVFVNLYGPIEITVDCTYFVVDRKFADTERIPIGFPCRNSDIIVLNKQNQPTRVNEPGELCVRGSSLALGYWNNPVGTAAAFVQNPLNTHYPELIYRTGDLVFRNDRGELVYVSRKDFQIKHLGYRIELGEIEHGVLQIDGIQNCCVVYNHDTKQIVLFFESNRDFTPGQIREQLGVFLPKYMLPNVFRKMDTLPRNQNGKIDRQRLQSDVDVDSYAQQDAHSLTKDAIGTGGRPGTEPFFNL